MSAIQTLQPSRCGRTATVNRYASSIPTVPVALRFAGSDDFQSPAGQLNQLVQQYVAQANPGVPESPINIPGQAQPAGPDLHTLLRFEQDLAKIDTTKLSLAQKGLHETFARHLAGEIYFKQNDAKLKHIGVMKPIGASNFAMLGDQLEKLNLPTFVKRGFYRYGMGALLDLMEKMGKGPTTVKEGALDKATYEKLLSFSEHNDLTLDQIADVAKNHMDALDRAMTKVAAKIDPSKSYKDIVKELDKDEVSNPQEMLKLYAKEITQSFQHAKNSGVLTIPVNNQPEVLEIIKALKDKAYAHYVPGFDIVGANTFMKQGRYMIPTIALHEAVPGHRLQMLSQASFAKGEVEKALGKDKAEALKLAPMSDFCLEGWATYAQKLMLELGYYKGDKEKLMALADLRRQARSTWITTQLISGKLAKEDAVKEMVALGAKEEDAKRSVSNILKMPTKVPSYFMGMAQILQLRAQVQNKMSLKEFHDRMLFLGPVPVSLIANVMFNETLKPLTATTPAELDQIYDTP